MEILTMRLPATAALILVGTVLFTTPGVAQQLTIEELRAKYPPNVEARDPGFHWAPEFHRETVTPQRDRIPLRTDWPEIEGLQRSPVTFGVPFADGALASTENARLVTADGTAIPADLRTTATWWGENGPVRWMLVSATLERDQEYFIEYGTAVEAFEADGMTVSESDDGIVIDTGPLQATVSKTKATILDEVTVGGQTVVTPEDAAANLPTVVGGDGIQYPASSDGMKVSFFRRGPMETVIRREGWYTSDAGGQYCQFITYTWFFAGSASVRHDHTLVVGFDTRENTIRDIRLAVALDGEIDDHAFSFSVSGEEAEAVSAEALPGRIVQTATGECVLTDGAGNTTRGARCGGWAGAQTASGTGAFVAVRDFSEQYPMELEVTHNALVAHLWPLHDAPVLDFAPSAVMGEEYPGDRVFWRDFYRGGLDAWTQAYGLGKTQNLRLCFHADDRTRDRVLSQAVAFETPVLVYADPKYACDTWAFGRVHHEDPEQFPKIEAVMDAILHRKYYLRNRLDNYGWIDFGDVNYQLSHPTDPDEIDYVHWRHWASMFYGGPNIFALMYMRSGDREAWDFARVNARHVTDIDICHLDDNGSLGFRYEKFKGGRYGGNGGICHYAADNYSIGCDHHLRFMLWDYYLNGTPRTWEVFDEFVSRHAARRHLGYNQIYRHRMTGGSLRFFSEAYAATWNPEYLSCAHQFADILYGAMDELGHTRYDDVYMNEGKVEYYQLTGDRRMRELFLNDMRVLAKARDAHVFADCRATTLWGLAHGYWFSGNRDLLPFAMWQNRIATTRVPTEGKPHEIGAVGWTFEHAYESTLGNQLPAFAALLTDVETPPAPAGPTGSTNGPIYLQETEDREFTFTVEVGMYEAGVPNLNASRFQNWREWVERLPEEDHPALVLTGPDNSVITRFALLGDSEQPMASFNGEDGRGKVQFTIPADDQTGTYVLRPGNRMVPIRMKLMASSLDGAVTGTGQYWVHAMTHNFRVPAGTKDFALEMKAIALRQEIGVTIHNGRGEKIASANWTVGSDCRHDWQRFELDAGAVADDETWSVSFLAPMATFLRLEGVPPFVASSGADLFTPERAMQMATIREPEGDAPSRVESPLSDGGQALALPPGVGLVLASPAGAPLMNETEGTVELWVRDTRQPTDLHNRSIIRCGDFHLYRRINIGTYLYMGPGYQTGMRLSPNRWVHVAATWRPSRTDEGKTEVALYLDGVRVENYQNRHLEAKGGWAGTDLRIPAQHAGLYVDELRVSDVARYDESFEPPQAPFEPDEHTLILSGFDNGAALVGGTAVEWESR